MEMVSMEMVSRSIWKTMNTDQLEMKDKGLLQH